MERETMKRVSDSKIEVIYQVRPEHLNGAGRLFGGRLMEWIDEIAGLVAIRHAQSNVITASVDNLKFLRGAFQGDLVVLIGRMSYVGNTSMEIRVDTYVESLDGVRRLINIAHLVQVAVDENGRPRKVPGLIVETEAEKAEWEAGVKRKEMRKLRKEEGF
ncbi:acyl-CoA thioesterase [Ruminococcus sp. OA3]|uniref:acyl-CoA thioesterase n=1 Tax=Ruminococcus sp. OA3 TaxID=2914164 RepID=UPI0031F52668